MDDATTFDLAPRDVADLLRMGLLCPDGSGRSTLESQVRRHLAAWLSETICDGGHLPAMGQRLDVPAESLEGVVGADLGQAICQGIAQRIQRVVMLGVLRKHCLKIGLHRIQLIQTLIRHCARIARINAGFRICSHSINQHRENLDRFGIALGIGQ